MSLFDKTNQNRTAFRNAAPFFPATIGESLQSSYDLVAGTETSLAFHNMEYDMFERYREQLEELTGDRLYNPLDHQAHFTAEAPGGFELQMEQWFKDVAKLRAKNPGVPSLSYDRLLEDIINERKKLREQRDEVGSREKGPGSALAGFIGGMGAAISDPLVLGSMAFGAPAASGLLRTVATEALLGAGSEVAVQGAVQATRDRLGEGTDFGRAAENILMAGLGGGILAGAIRGGITGTRALLRRVRELPEELRTPDVKAAEQILQRKAEMEESNPFGPTLAAQIEHARRLDQAILNARRPISETLRSTTAIGRALPMDENIDLPIIKAEETLEQYTARVRQERPELFGEVEAVAKRSSEVHARLSQIDAEIAQAGKVNFKGAVGLEKLRARVEALEADPKADPRKLKRARRKAQEAADVPEVAAGVHVRSLQKEKAALEAEAKELQASSKRLAKQVKKAVKQTARRRGPSEAPFVAAIDQSAFDEGQKAINKAMARLGREAADAAPTQGILTREADISTPRPAEPLTVDPEIERAVKNEADIDAELARNVEQEPDRVIPVEDEETGAIREITLSQRAEELEAERKLYDEFEKCIREALG